MIRMSLGAFAACLLVLIGCEQQQPAEQRARVSNDSERLSVLEKEVADLKASLEVEKQSEDIESKYLGWRIDALTEARLMSILKPRIMELREPCMGRLQWSRRR
jgi:hypothetical protein